MAPLLVAGVTGIDLSEAQAWTGANAAGNRFLIPRIGTDYDYRALYLALVAIKKQSPRATLLSLTAEDEIALEHIVATMDTTRLRLESDSTTSLQAFNEALYQGRFLMEGEHFAELFPDVIWSLKPSDEPIHTAAGEPIVPFGGGIRGALRAEK